MKSIFFVLAALALNGCAAKVERQFPVEFATENNTPLIEVLIDETESNKISYIASDILPKSERDSFHKKALFKLGDNNASYNDGAETKTNDHSKLNVGDQAMVATNFSDGGAAMSMGVTAFNTIENFFAVSPEDGVNYKNQVYLSGDYKKPLKARIEAMKLLDTKIRNMAEIFGATVSCTSGCKLLGNAYWLRSYAIEGIDYSKIEGFKGAYKPSSIVIDLNLGEMVRMESDPVLNNIIGDTARWMFSSWYGFDLWIGDKYLRTESGKRIAKPFLKGASGNRYELNACIHSFAIGRQVRKMIFSDKNMYSINSSKYCDRNNTIVNNGTVYTYDPTDLNGSFVRMKVTN